MEEERSWHQEVIAKMEARLNEYSRILEQVSLASRTGPLSHSLACPQPVGC